MSKNQFFQYLFWVVASLPLFFGTYNLFWLKDIPSGLGYISIGLAAYSIGHVFGSREISEQALDIAKRSDETMRTVSNVDFIDVESNLQKGTLAKLNRLSNTNEIFFLLFMWRTGLMKATRLKKWTNEGERDGMIFPFITVMEHLPWENDVVTNIDVSNILEIYESIRHLDPSEKRKKKLMELFETHIGKIKENETFNDLSTRIGQEISLKDPKALFRKNEV